MQSSKRIGVIISAIFTLVMTLSLAACSGKEAYLISRTLLGYIPPPEVPTVMEQLKEELIRCEQSGGSQCEQQAVAYVRTVNDSLKRKPMKGVVIIRRVDNDFEVEYEAEEETPIDSEDSEDSEEK